MIDAQTALAIAAMAIVTYATRIAGPVLMRFAPITPRIERLIDAASQSAIAALVASSLARQGPREAAAVAVAGVVMLLTRKPLAAMVAAMTVAAAWRAVL